MNKETALPGAAASTEAGLRSLLFFSTTRTGSLFSLSCVSKTGGGEKKEKQNSQRAPGGWQHSANRKGVCAASRPIGGRRARGQCVLSGRLEETGCVAVGGRGLASQQCQSKPSELLSVKLGERSIECMLPSLTMGIQRYHIRKVQM